MRISDWSSDVCSSDLSTSACMGELDADETMIAGLRQAEVEGTRARCAGDEIYRRIDAVAVEHGASEDHPRQTVAGSLRTDGVPGLPDPGLCHRTEDSAGGKGGVRKGRVWGRRG